MKAWILLVLLIGFGVASLLKDAEQGFDEED